jgi:hypothetical protein
VFIIQIGILHILRYSVADPDLLWSDPDPDPENIAVSVLKYIYFLCRNKFRRTFCQCTPKIFPIKM